MKKSIFVSVIGALILLSYSSFASEGAQVDGGAQIGSADNHVQYVPLKKQVNGATARDLIEALRMSGITATANPQDDQRIYVLAEANCHFRNSMGLESDSDDYSIPVGHNCTSPDNLSTARAKVLIDALASAGVADDAAGPHTQFLAKDIRCTIFKAETSDKKRFVCVFEDSNRTQIR